MLATPRNRVCFDYQQHGRRFGHHTWRGDFYLCPGTVVNLVATPDTGFCFFNWTGDVGTIADVNATTTITMNGDYAITTNFLDPKEGNPCNCG